MGDLVRVTGGRHRRGDGTVFEQGDVFEATEAELEAFADKFEPVEETDEGYESTETTETADTGPAEAGRYELVSGGTHRLPDGVVEEGDVVELSEAEVEAFGDKFAPVDDSDGGADSAESADATEDVAEADDEAEAESSEAESEGAPEDEAEAEADSGPDEIPDPLPDEYRDLQELSKAFGIDARQSKAELEDQLAAQRDSSE